MSKFTTLASAAHLTAIETIGTRLDSEFTAEEALLHGGLGGWNVRLWPHMATDPATGRQIAVPDSNDVVRDTEDGGVAVLSKRTVSDGFTVIQNEAHIEFLNTLAEESGAKFELAGAVDGGRRVFVSMKLQGGLLIGGQDQIENSLVAINSHDGSMSFTLAVMPVRYACSNLLNTRWGKLGNLIRIRHTSGATKGMVAKAREALDISFDYLEEFQVEAERMINTTMTQAQFEEIIDREFGAPEDAADATKTRCENKIDEIMSLYAEADTQEGYRGTAWAGFNALTEWADHYAPTRGEDRDRARATNAIFQPKFKERARELMLGV